jgi:hypothetical protein
MMFHAHCLSPNSFFADVLSRECFQHNCLSFPLERLHLLIATGTWSDPESEKVWNDTFSTPYQLWANDPRVGGALALQSPNPSSNADAVHSVDLANASRRQRKFATKITGDSYRVLNSRSAVRRSITRYCKFMRLFHCTSSQSLVPTNDIDLCWHTHQLYSFQYRNWCIEHVGRTVNHVDDPPSSLLDNGFRETSLTWFEVYGESYDATESGSASSATCRGTGTVCGACGYYPCRCRDL